MITVKNKAKSYNGHPKHLFMTRIFQGTLNVLLTISILLHTFDPNSQVAAQHIYSNQITKVIYDSESRLKNEWAWEKVRKDIPKYLGNHISDWDVGGFKEVFNHLWRLEDSAIKICADKMSENITNVNGKLGRLSYLEFTEDYRNWFPDKEHSGNKFKTNLNFPMISEIADRGFELANDLGDYQEFMAILNGIENCYDWIYSSDGTLDSLPDKKLVIDELNNFRSLRDRYDSGETKDFYFPKKMIWLNYAPAIFDLASKQTNGDSIAFKWDSEMRSSYFTYKLLQQDEKRWSKVMENLQFEFSSKQQAHNISNLSYFRKRDIGFYQLVDWNRWIKARRQEWVLGLDHDEKKLLHDNPDNKNIFYNLMTEEIFSNLLKARGLVKSTYFGEDAYKRVLKSSRKYLDDMHFVKKFYAKLSVEVHKKWKIYDRERDLQTAKKLYEEGTTEEMLEEKSSMERAKNSGFFGVFGMISFTLSCLYLLVFISQRYFNSCHGGIFSRFPV